TDRATERVTRSLSFVTCIWPKCNPLLSSLIVTSTPQRHAYILRIAPALASVRLVTRILTPFGPSLRRFLDSPLVPSPSGWSVARRVKTQESFRRPSGWWLARREAQALGKCWTRSRRCLPFVHCRVRGIANTEASGVSAI